MDTETMYVTLFKNGDGTVQMKGRCQKGNYVWVVNRSVRANELFGEMFKIADHTNNDLKIGCEFVVE